jgi:hypothetical protein
VAIGVTSGAFEILKNQQEFPFLVNNVGISRNNLNFLKKARNICQNLFLLGDHFCTDEAFTETIRD